MIRPKNYAMVWSDSDWLYAEFSTPTPDKTYTVKYPNSPEGLSRLFQALHVRTEWSLIGQDGSPTQWQIDEFKGEMAGIKPGTVTYVDKRGQPITPRRVKSKFSPQLQDAAKDVLRKLGMI